MTVNNPEHIAVRDSNRRDTVIHCYVITKLVSRRSGSELHAKFHILKRRDFDSAVSPRSHIVPSRFVTELAIELEATLSSRHLRRDLERRRRANRARAISSSLRGPDSVQRSNIFAVRFESVNHAESITIERFTDKLTASSIQSPAGQASVCTAHDIARLQRFSTHNTSKRVSAAELHIRAIEHNTVNSKVLVVSERVRVLQKRSLDKAETRTNREHVAIGVFRPVSRSITLDRELRIRIEDVIRCENFEFNVIERNIVFHRRNPVNGIAECVFASRSRVIAVSERSGERVTTLFPTDKFDNRVIMATCASTPVSVQRRDSSRIAISRERIDKVIVQLREHAADIAIGIERVTQQAIVTAVQRHRELLVVIVHIHTVARFHDPVADSIRAKRIGSDIRCPGITEVSLASRIFIERNGVFHGIRRDDKLQILLTVGNSKHIAVRDFERRSRAIIQCDVIAKLVSRRSRSELNTEFHVFEHRNFDAAVITRSNTIRCLHIANLAIDFERTLFRWHLRRDSERRRRANRARSIGIARIRPNGVQRTDIHILRRERIKLAECFGIERTDHVLSSSIQSPAGQAGIRAAHDVEVLQIPRFSDTSNRVRLSIDHFRAIEHFPAIGIVLVVIERVEVLEERSLDVLDITRHREQAILRHLVPIRTCTCAIDERRIRIHDVVFIVINNKRPTRERNVIVCTGDRHIEARSCIVVCHPIFTFRSLGIAQAERPVEYILTLFQISKDDGLLFVIGRASPPNSVQRHRIITGVRTTFVQFNKLVIQFGKHIVRICFYGLGSVASQADFVAVQFHRERLVTIDGIIRSHNPVAIIFIRLERSRINAILPAITEVRQRIQARGIFVEREVVIHRLSRNVEFHIVLTSENFEHATVRQSLRRRAVIDRYVRIERIAHSLEELDTELQTFHRRDFHAGCPRSHLVPKRVFWSDDLINPEFTLCSSHVSRDLERRRRAKITRTINVVRSRPNRIQRISLRRRGKCAESVKIIRFQHRAASPIQSPTSQASIRAAHDIEVLQSFRSARIVNRIRYSLCQILAEEHLARISTESVPVVSKFITALEERSLHRNVLVDIESTRNLGPRCRGFRLVHVRSFVIQHVIRYACIERKLNSRERYIAFGNHAESRRRNNIIARRRRSQIVQCKLAGQRKRTHVRIVRHHGIDLRRIIAIAPLGVKRRLASIAESGQLFDKFLRQGAVSRFISIVGSERIAIEALAHAIQSHRERIAVREPDSQSTVTFRSILVDIALPRISVEHIVVTGIRIER